jgi:hypothetical protein
MSVEAIGASHSSSEAVVPGDLSTPARTTNRTAPAPAVSSAAATAAQPLDVSVVVPTRNAEALIHDCLASEAASAPVVALIDVDVRLGDGDLERLLTEFRDGKYTGLQAGLHSVSGSGYWGRALAQHHRTGRSKNWFGVVATVIDRDVLLRHGFDERFLSGEDIDLRWRLQKAGAKIGVSRRTIVDHRFGDSWETAKGQFLADGHGLGRMISAHGRRALRLLVLPAAAAVRGIALSVARRQPQWIPYYLVFAVYNYLAMGRELALRAGRRRRRLGRRAGE